MDADSRASSCTIMEMKNRKEYPIIDRDLVGGEDDFVNSGGEGEGEGDTVLLYTLSSSLLSFRSGRMRQ